MARTIGVVTVARSDYGHLVPLLERIRSSRQLELQLFVGGSHLSERFGLTVATIEADGWPITDRIAAPSEADAPADVAAAAAAGLAGFARAFARHRPDLILVLGDRIEMLSAAVAALPLTMPVAHVHGGEVTEGAIDEQARHAITKLSHLHFPAAEPYARRIFQMGEEPWRVHCCGAPGLDRLARVAALSREDLARRIGLPLRRPTLLVTFHPVTLEAGDTAAHVDALAAALEVADGDVVITYPGADTMHRTVVRRLETLAAGRPGTRLVAALGEDTYCSLLREADVMVGNSSSGLIEAPSFGLPVVNIGSRQRGRLRAANVIDVGHATEEIRAGLRRALDPAFRRSLAGMANPYGDGRAAPRIVEVLERIELGPRLIQKRFVDLDGPPR
ncbi:MAG TPA: UDP-N-acetylglucosamine 2-epimerase [Candidatus Limnocylindria bacterium]|nr:UDP-N-acetylglucosamine 2-epimerase [Candidatus Limnocylindria bacterium]